MTRLCRNTKPKKQKKSKYKNQKCVVDGISFDSKLEARRWQDLKLLERAGVITDLKRQVPFELIPTQRPPGEPTMYCCKYIADFTYYKDGKFIVEDAKGQETEAFKIKQKLMYEKHGIVLRITK